MHYSHLLVLLFALGSGSLLFAADDERGHEESGHKEERHNERGHEQEGAAALSEVQIRTAGIEIMTVQHSNITDIINAPGEVALNAYRTTKVTPRIEAQILQRHARLGDTVTAGQELVTLSSVEVAQVQGELLVNDREWKRVKKLGRKVVSERRYIEAQVARQQAHARLQAYGMTDTQIQSLLKQSDSSRATGELVLLSPQRGTVIRDDFIVGELAEPGRELFVITDETTLWVDARLTPEDAANIRVGAPARIKVNDRWLDGEVVQARHALDESTRTLSVRVQVANPDDQLHPGQFVSVEIQSAQRKPGIAVPLAAVLRSPDGDWQVFIEEQPGRYEPKEIEVLRTVGKRMVIDGLEDGERIVSKGAFFIQSEIAKGGFEVHNH
ncbi:RND family efflux transporter MFP subunit [Thiogranum longum]|uniref:RND family efflux transporter MFP subunit n=1 Tax=Thiogranum longum TaxID=1537524 RepID=A0A4R1HC97_9GAMM|nr:efflux RND transporter periplasmic adaptor subunit [Thiogranum longum]TCK17865.1 RND family efflux transporter MFP subunit [Thiogranum longum]